MKKEKLYTILFATALIFIIGNALLGISGFLIFIVRILPFIILIGLVFLIKKTMTKIKSFD